MLTYEQWKAQNPNLVQIARGMPPGMGDQWLLSQYGLYTTQYQTQQGGGGSAGGTNSAVQDLIDQLGQQGITVDANTAQIIIDGYNKAQSWLPSYISLATYAFMYMQQHENLDAWIRENFPPETDEGGGTNGGGTNGGGDNTGGGGDNTGGGGFENVPMPTPGTPEYYTWAEDNPVASWLQRLSGSGNTQGSAFQQYLERQYYRQRALWDIQNNPVLAGAGQGTSWGAYQPDWGLRSARQAFLNLAGQPSDTDAYTTFNTLDTEAASNAYRAAILALQSGGLGGSILDYLLRNESQLQYQYLGSPQAGTMGFVQWLQNRFGIR